ncbi:MAG: FkbM family methyltransferase [Desulfosalsimonadaceae bacterium]
MSFNLRRQLLNLMYDTPLESFARKTYMFLFQRENFHTDRLTTRVLKKVLRPASSCIDIGCYRGEILRHIVRLAPGGRIFAVEPCPYHHDFLVKKFPQVQFFPVALDKDSGFATFHFDREYPARSGLLTGKDAGGQMEEIQVRVEKLDNLIPEDITINFIKIDVEGAEYPVISGGRNLIKRSRPVIIFEHGAGASGMYGRTSGDLYDLICEDIGLRLSTMDRWLAERPPFDRKTFIDCVNAGKYSDFIAY